MNAASLKFRKTSRGRWASTLLVGAVAVSMAGCTSASTGSSDDKVDDSSITIMIQNGLVPQFETYAEAYTKEFPDREVVIQSAPDDGSQYAQQLVTARLGDSLTDIVMNIDFVAERLATGNVTFDIGPWLKEGKDDLSLDSFTPNFVGQYRPSADPEAVTGLPVSADSVVLFWNKSLFDKAGVNEYPEPDWTWDDLYRVASKVQDGSDGQFFGITAPLGNGGHAHVFTPVIAANGGYVYDPETNKVGIGEPEAIKAWGTLLEFYGTASAPYDANPSAQPGFGDRQAAMALSVRAGVPSTKEALGSDEWDAEVMPTIDGNPTAGGGSYGLSITQTSKKKNAAWAFLAWFYSTDGGMKLAQASGQAIPPTLDGLENGSWRDFPAPPANTEAFAEAARTAVLQVQLPGQGGTVLNDAVTKAMQQVLLEGRDIEEAFTEAAQSVQDAVDAEGGSK